MGLTFRSVKGQKLTSVEADENIRFLWENDDGLLLPKTRGVGIKVDVAAPDFGWQDIIGDALNDASNVNKADLVAYVGNIKQVQFAVGNESFFNYHIPHDYAMGTDIFIHLHWSHNSLLVTSGAPSFSFEATYAKSHNQMAFGTPTSLTLTEAASITRYQQMLTEMQLSNNGGTGGLIDTNLIEPDGLILACIGLDINTMTGGALPFVHAMDIHYQSTGLATKQRAPDFWT